MLLALGDPVLDVKVRAAGPGPGGDGPGEVVLQPGGSAANVAAWATHLGLPARLVGAVGDDDLGRLLAADAARTIAEPRLVVDPVRRSRAVAVWLAADGDRTIVADPGAAMLSDRDFDASWFDDATWTHVLGHTLALARTRPLFARVVAECRARAIPFSFDPGSVALLAADLRREQVLDAVAGAAALFPTREEARFLTGCEDPAAAARALAARFPVVLVTCDRDGAVGAWDGEVVPIAAAAPPAAVIDATGAGDAFAAGFLSARAAGATLPDAAAAAAAAGARSVATLGARPPG